MVYQTRCFAACQGVLNVLKVLALPFVCAITVFGSVVDLGIYVREKFILKEYVHRGCRELVISWLIFLIASILTDVCNVVRGVVQVVTTPLAWLVRMPFRWVLTQKYDYQTIEETSKIKRLIAQLKLPEIYKLPKICEGHYYLFKTNYANKKNKYIFELLKYEYTIRRDNGQRATFADLCLVSMLYDQHIAALKYYWSTPVPTEHAKLTLALECKKYKLALKIFNKSPELVNKPMKNACTPLTLVVLGQKMMMVNRLLEAGADVNLADGRGDTALMYAAMTGNYQILSVLLEHGAKLNLQRKVDPQIADLRVYFPSFSRYCAIVKGTLTALMLALLFKQGDCAMRLLKAGADYNTNVWLGSDLMSERFSAYDIARHLMRDDEIFLKVFEFMYIKEKRFAGAQGLYKFGLLRKNLYDPNLAREIFGYFPGLEGA